MDDKEGTQFLNVDLDILSRVPLNSIVEAFGEKVDVLHVGRWGRRYCAHVEVSGSGTEKQADRLIRRLVGLVEKLPGPVRRLWNEAESKEFNVGIEAAVRWTTFELRLEPETLEAVASLGGRLVITVYASERLHRSPRRRVGRKRTSKPSER